MRCGVVRRREEKTQQEKGQGCKDGRTVLREPVKGGREGGGSKAVMSNKCIRDEYRIVLFSLLLYWIAFCCCKNEKNWLDEFFVFLYCRLQVRDRFSTCLN